MVSFIQSLIAVSALLTSHSFATLVARNDGPTSPPCSVPFTPYLYAGCYTDPGTPRALVFAPVGLDKQKMTVETCTAVCKGNNFRYAGIEYYGECYCGDSIRGMPAADNACTFPCTGNKTQTCGGNKLVSVYMDPTYPTSDSSSIVDYTPEGCYTEGYNGRAVAFRQGQLSSTNLTTEDCLGACKSQNFPLAATEYGGECYCGVVLGNGTTSAPDTDCNTKCTGDPTEICGGRSRLNLFVADDLMSKDPCSPFVLPPPIVRTLSTTSQSQTSSSSSSSSTVSTSTSSSESSSTTSTSAAASTTPTSSSSTTSETTSSDASSTTSESTTSSTETSESSISQPTSSSSTITSQSSYTPTETSPTETSTTTSSTSDTTTSSTSDITTTSISDTTTSQTKSSSTSSTSSTPSTSSTSSTISTSSTLSTTSIPSTSSTFSTSSTASTSSTSSTPSTLSTSSTVNTSKCTTAAPAPTPTCEYGCGKWCSKPIPIFTDHPTCKVAVAECILQIADCFLSAGWPASLQCAKYQSWCQSISSYCGDICYNRKCSKSDCVKQNPPIGGQTTTSSSTANVCPATSQTTTSSSSTSSTVPVPTVSSICILPNGPSGSGYEKGKCVGGIQPPALTCNNIAREFPTYPLKLYTSKESSKCGGYTRSNVPQACKDACLAQYTSCVGTYATGCKGYVQRGEQDSYESAKGKCERQYGDCLTVNRGASVGGRCASFGVGWS